MYKITNFFSALPIILLLVFPETTIKTSLALNKTSCHSIYLCKVNLGLGVADWIIVFMAAILIFYTILNYGRVYINKDSIFYKLLIIYLIYLIIGIFYNIFVYHDLIAYLYDFKTFMYFAVTYYWFRVFCSFKITSNNIIFIFLIMAIGPLWDYFYLLFDSGIAQRPNLIPFMPVIMPLIEYNFIILLMICFKQHRLILLFFLIFEILSIFNQASLNSIYGLFAFFVFIFLYQKRFGESLIFILLFLAILIFSIFLPLVIYEILPLITNLKSDGLDIRVMKTLAAWDNYFMNFPVIIGKGLGSTYFETFSSVYNNIYSHGINHQEGNVKFILHSPLAMFYKFGLVGGLIMIFILLKSSIKLFSIYKLRNNNLAKFMSMLYPLFIIGTLITPGILKGAILAGIFIYISDQIISEFNRRKFKVN